MMNSSRVLIVDDDPRYLDLLRFTLEGEGFEVLTAASAIAAMEIAASRQPHVIVSDLAMPDVDGYALAAGLKADPRTAAIPLVFVTARSQADERRAGRAVGAAEYLTKPFAIADLVQKIHHLCEPAEARTP